MRKYNSRISKYLEGLATIESFVVMRNVHMFLPSVGMELTITAVLYPHFYWDGLRTKGYK
jgi:hypothetical protein